MMKRTLKMIAAGLLFCGAGGAVSMLAQDNGTDGPPKVLYVVREIAKPGKGGAMHEKTESAFVNALTTAKAPMHYLALTSISGHDRALFLSGYSSFAEMAAEHKTMGQIAGLSARIDAINVTDGELLSETTESAWIRNSEQSMNTRGLTGVRMMEISKYVVKPGHKGEWDEAVKMVKAAYEKGVPEANWVMYDQAYGEDGDAHLVIVLLKSMEEIDHNFADGKKFEEAMGESGMKKLDELMASGVSSYMTNLFVFNPKMSNPPEAWVKAEPDFWKPKMAPPGKKVEKKGE